jgi:LuxR family transcriptional regulator, quorum-sensing system regulator CciR
MCVPALELQHALDHLRGAASMNELALLLADITHALGFHYFAMLHHVDLRGSPADIIHIDNYPAAWREPFIEDLSYRTDPVFRACTNMAVGFIWEDVPGIIPLTNAQLDILARAPLCGLGPGFTIPAHVTGEHPGSCSFAMRAGCTRPEKSLLAAQCLGMFAFQAARRIKGMTIRPTCPPQLSPRQRDCLLWAMKGKTDWEIAAILGISEETVTQHLNSARARYGVAKRLPLALHAVFDGEISLSEALR